MIFADTFFPNENHHFLHQLLWVNKELLQTELLFVIALCKENTLKASRIFSPAGLPKSHDTRFILHSTIELRLRSALVPEYVAVVLGGLSRILFSVFNYRDLFVESHTLTGH